MIRCMLRAVAPRRLRFTEMLRAHVERITAGRIASGPFQGTPTPHEAVGSVALPKLLGTYELELHATIETICAAEPDHVVIAGAAEGYYAVGLATRLKGDRIIAYEANPLGREFLAQNWKTSGLAPERLDLRDICTVSRLRTDVQMLDGGWLIMDVEGAEALLADPEVIPALVRVAMLIEVHEFLLPGVGALLRERFSASHHLVEVPARARVAEEFPSTLWPDRGRGLLRGAAVALMDEQRPAGMSWLVLQPGRSPDG